MSDSFLSKSNQIYIFLFFTVTLLVLAESILIPLVFAALLSLLILPLVRRVEVRLKSKTAGALVGVLTLIFILGIILFLLFHQLRNLLNDYVLIETKLLEKYKLTMLFIAEQTGMDNATLAHTLKEQLKGLLSSSFTMIQSFLVGIGSFLFSLTLVFLYSFFILLYRNKIRLFLLSFVRNEKESEIMEEVIEKIKKLVLNYLTGLFLALFIIGCMNALGLLIIGIEHGIFLGLLAGFLNIIPYVGSFIGGALPILFALIYKDSLLYPILILGVFMFNQFIDNNITTPKVVGGYVKVNPLATILAVFVGGMIWGVVGMILFIPLTGIFKIVCDSIPSLQRFSLLLGDE
ncbi:MAG: AI-2E family transporter [Cytophagaceae bacterium]|jgi:predicted PurR-regulated permease PerM|nr:AI-2E family transporter [Cytophagaceae bacterium]